MLLGRIEIDKKEVFVFYKIMKIFILKALMWSRSYCSWIYCCLRLSQYYLEFVIVHPVKIFFYEGLEFVLNNNNNDFAK